ncbi:Uncharacterised protein g10431 [Pycnogonum litorale]
MMDFSVAVIKTKTGETFEIVGDVTTSLSQNLRSLKEKLNAKLTELVETERDKSSIGNKRSIDEVSDSSDEDEKKSKNS